MKNNLRKLAATMGLVLVLSGCQMTSAEDAFATQLEGQGYTVHRKYVTADDGVIHATVDAVRGCVVGFKQNEGDASSYWLYAFFKDGEHAWPDGPRNFNRLQLTEAMDKMMTDPNSSKPEKIDQCYNKNSP